MFKPIIDRVHSLGSGNQKIYQFPNGFGASVVHGYGGSYSNSNLEREVAIIKFDDNDDYQLTYKTPITDDVIGHVPLHLLDKLLLHISLLNKSGNYRGIGIPDGLGDYR